MAPEHLLLRAIKEDPDDDTRRLVFADWLEENGQPERAEFIRVQVEEAGLRSSDRRREELERRASALEARNKARWLKPLRDAGWSIASCSFHRGFTTLYLSAPS